MATSLINGLYPVDYLFLQGVDQIQYPEEFWWASRHRDPGTTDYLELDYGRVRQVNYLKFSVLRAPINIFIWYDAISDDDGTHKWVKLTPVPAEKYEDTTHYTPSSRSMFIGREFYFTDAQGNTINTRFIRIGFQRRIEDWPHTGAQSFKWPIIVKGGRSSRFVNEYADTLGTLFDAGAADDDPGKRTLMGITSGDYSNPSVTTSGWIEQDFSFTDDVARLWNSTDEADWLWPKMLGFSVLAYIDVGTDSNPTDPNDVRMDWQFLVNGEIVKTGITNGAISQGRSWINTYFDTSAPINTNNSDSYSIRVRSLTVHDSQGNALFGKTIADSNYPGFYYRLWGDVGDTGRDVLGNLYREGTRIDSIETASQISASGWMSEPQPSTAAVEALYFDCRYKDDNGAQQPAVIDALKISPRTPGVTMHMYYTANHLNSDRPLNDTQYDAFVWTPINSTFVLTGTQKIIDLPDPIKAAFVKIEFTNLQPQAFKVPSRPDLPTQTYKRYPTWIEMQFRDKAIRQAVNSYFLQAEQTKQVNIPYFTSLATPILEFQYKERVFLAALGANQAIKTTQSNSTLINQKSNNYLDPVSLSKIHVQTPTKFQGPLTLQVDLDSVLGQTIAASQDTSLRTIIRENGNISQVVNANGTTAQSKLDISFTGLANTPMWFNQTCRHIYAIDSAKFNKVAYFAGIDYVQFLRKDYTVERDDTLISENFHDLQMIASSDWVPDQPSKLYNDVVTAVEGDSVLSLVVDYTIDGVSVMGEQFALGDVDATYTFAMAGGLQAIGVSVYQDQNPMGTPVRGFLYTFDQDYDLNVAIISGGDNSGLFGTTLSLDVQHERLITQPPSS